MGIKPEGTAKLTLEEKTIMDAFEEGIDHALLEGAKNMNKTTTYWVPEGFRVQQRVWEEVERLYSPHYNISIHGSEQGQCINIEPKKD